MAPLAVTKARAEVTLLVAFSGQWIFALHMFYRVSQTKLFRLELWAEIGYCGAKFCREHVLGEFDHS